MENKLAGFLFNKVGVDDCKKFLDIASFRHKLTAGNVANVDTPGYKARDIDFDAELKRVRNESGHLAGTLTDSNHIPLGVSSQGSPDVNQRKIASGDLNSVNIDTEITTLAENELQYTAAARMLQKKFQMLKSVITSK